MEATGPVRTDAHEPVLHLGWDGNKPFEVNANILATGRTCVIGASGSGKSYAVGVICEELCKNQVPFAIVDTEGEHSGLKEKYEVILVGDDGACDLQWSTLDLGQLASQAPDIAPLVLDVSETEKPKEMVGGLLSAIYDEVEMRRTPYLVIVEEADRFVPQNGERLPIFGEVARRGRKRGMGLMVCTQRPSLVDKNILSQCGNQLIGKLVIKNDLQAVSQFFSGHELPKHLTTLEAGRFFAMGGLSASAQSITIRKKDTRHGGTTPKLGIRVVKPFQAALMAAFRKSERSGTGKEAGMVGINPTFQPEDVPVIVKRDKSFIFFGREEVVANAHLIFRPLVEVGVAIKTGVLKKRIEMRYLILDGQTGKFVELGDVPVMYEGLQRLMGLNSEEIEILRTTMPDRDMSILEIANKIGVSKEALRKPIRLLEEKRLIRSFQLGKARVFRRIFGFPDFQWHESEQPLESVEGSKAKVEEYKLDEENVREVVKGLISYSDVQSFKRFVYPLYRVELIMKRKKRVVWLDGQSGKEIHP
jgi:DNA-binding Lrp family transcriptional regulator